MTDHKHAEVTEYKRFYWWCEECSEYGPEYDTEGRAEESAAQHNNEHHGHNACLEAE